MRKDYPILEYDPEKVAIIQPGRNKRDIQFPERCVMTFFGDTVEKYSQGDGVQTRHSTKWETGTVRVYEMRYKGVEVCFVHTYVGAPIAVGIMEFLMAYAAAQFRGVKFAQLLYSGDIVLKNDSWDERGWQRNVSAREKLFLLSLDACLKI